MHRDQVKEVREVLPQAEAEAVEARHLLGEGVEAEVRHRLVEEVVLVGLGEPGEREVLDLRVREVEEEQRMWALLMRQVRVELEEERSVHGLEAEEVVQTEDLRVVPMLSAEVEAGQELQREEEAPREEKVFLLLEAEVAPVLDSVVEVDRRVPAGPGKVVERRISGRIQQLPRAASSEVVEEAVAQD